MELRLDGRRFEDYPGFVAEFNGAYLGTSEGLPWNGEIDDLHEILEAAQEKAGHPPIIHWIHSQKSRSDLDHQAMARTWRAFRENVPESVFSPDGVRLVSGWHQERIDRALAGQGRTLFEYLVWQMTGDDGDAVDLRLE